MEAAHLTTDVASKGDREGVGSNVKPCGWFMRVDRTFTGHAIVACGSHSQTSSLRVEAARQAFESAGTQALNYVRSQYQMLRCAKGCAKLWEMPDPIDFTALSTDRPRKIFRWFSIESVQHSIEGKGQEAMHYCEMRLRCDLTLHCWKGDERTAPDDELLDAARQFFRLF